MLTLECLAKALIDKEELPSDSMSEEQVLAFEAYSSEYVQPQRTFKKDG